MCRGFPLPVGAPRQNASMIETDLSAFVSIVAAVMICMIGLGVENPGGMPVKAFAQSDFVTAFSAVTNIIFAYSRFPSMASFELH